MAENVERSETETVAAPIPPSEVESQLRTLSRRADEWLDDRADQFDPLTWGDVEKRRVRRKAFGEVALYLHMAEADGEPRAQRLKQLVIERANDPSYYRLLARNPGEAHKYGYPLVYASLVDDLSEDAAETLEQTLDRRRVWATELPPFRALDLRHLARMYGHDVPYVDVGFEELLDRSCVNHPLNPAEVLRKDAYALTHDFLFYHNFGNAGERFPDEPLAYEYPETLHGLLLRFVAAGDCDLVGEVLLSAALQRQLPPGLARFGLGWLLDQVSEDGYVPSPGDGLPISAVDSSDDLESLDMGEWSDESAIWGQHYHPTLVGATLGRVLRRAWPDLDSPEHRRDLDYEAEAENLYALGEAFCAFADYDLAEGAMHLREVAGTPTAAAYPDVVEFAVEFLEAQRQPNGEFGYWTDEKQVYLSMDESHDEKHFEEQLLRPTSEACADALDAVRGKD